MADAVRQEIPQLVATASGYYAYSWKSRLRWKVKPSPTNEWSFVSKPKFDWNEVCFREYVNPKEFFIDMESLMAQERELMSDWPVHKHYGNAYNYELDRRLRGEQPRLYSEYKYGRDHLREEYR